MRIAASMRQLVRSAGLNSMVFGVWKNSQPLVVGALGSELPGVRATKDMHFRIGNVTESFTVTLLLQLVDRRKVRLDDPVSRWFPQLPRARQVTLRMLATSTAGYADYVTNKSFEEAFAANPFRNFSAMALIRLGTTAPPVFAPGESWAFSDTNFLLLGEILEKITHQPLATALQQQILIPLKLGQTHMPSSAYIPPPVMHAYSPERGRYEESTYWNPSWASLTGSMTSSLFDMAKWAAALGSGSFLSHSSHRFQVGPGNVGLGPLTAKAYYGAGVIVSKHWVITNPQLLGYNGTVSYLPKQKLAVVVFTTVGPRTDFSTQYSLKALLRIAHIVTPRAVPAVPTGGRVH